MSLTPEQRAERMNSHVSTWTTPERDAVIQAATIKAQRSRTK